MTRTFITLLAATALVTAPVRAQRQDPADSLYRAARAALNSDDNSRAAQLFGEIVRRYPSGARAEDALYYNAYALFRNGGRSDLATALDQLDKYDRTYRDGIYADDAASLRVRVCGTLARTGDERCGREVMQRSTAGSGTNVSGTSSGRAVSSSGGSGTGRTVAGSGGNRGTSTGVTRRGSGGSNSEADDDRMMALNALLQMNSDQAVPLLKEVLAKRDNGSIELRKTALFILSQKRTADVVDVLLASAKNDPDPDVRSTAVFWLSATKDPRTVPVVRDLLLNSSDREIQKKAIFSLAQMNSQAAREALRDFATKRGGSVDLRSEAIFWLGQSGGGANTEFLMSIAKNSSEDSQLRGKAIFAISQARGSLNDLASLYSSLNDKQLKEQVIFGLTQTNESAAVDKLIDIARNEKDRDLRSKAVFWLGQSSKDPRVAKFLRELINQ